MIWPDTAYPQSLVQVFCIAVFTCLRVLYVNTLYGAERRKLKQIYMENSLSAILCTHTTDFRLQIEEITPLFLESRIVPAVLLRDS